MKTFLVVLVFGFVAVTFASKEKRLTLPKRCSHSSVQQDCGKDSCCLNVLHLCAPLRGEGQSCNLVGMHGCGCKDGLSCQVSSSWGPFKYYKCLKTPSSSGDGAF